MARISNKQVYKIVEPTSSDYLIGTDAEDLNRTKTFTIQGIADFVSQNVTVGVGSLNGLVGAVTLSAGVGLELTENGNTLTLSLSTPDFVESINGLEGAVTVEGSTNIGVTDNGTDTITLTALNVAKINEANTFLQDQTLDKSLTVSSGLLSVNSVSQNVGINKIAPSYQLDVVGDSNITGSTGEVLTLTSPNEVGADYILFNNSLDANKGWVGYKGASDTLQLRSLISDVDIIAVTSVSLSYGGTTRLETTATGVEITGGLDVGDITATSIAITGGAATQFLKADGSLDGTAYQDTTEKGQADGYAPLNSLSKIDDTYLPNDLERTTNKGQANGYAPLDSGAKVPIANIPDSVLGQVTYEGTWDANNNLPLLANPPAADTKGDYYVCSSNGTQFGITFQTGDWIISNGTAWEKVDNTDAVTSVFGRLGNILPLQEDYDDFYLTLTGVGQIVGSIKTFQDNKLRLDAGGFATYLSNTSGIVQATGSHNTFGFNGNNDIYFSSDVGGNQGVIRFNNTDTRFYDLQDSSGTLAFLSDIPAETDTLDSVTTRGNTTTNDITVGGATINGTTSTSLITGIGLGSSQQIQLGSDAIVLQVGASPNVLIGAGGLFNVYTGANISGDLTAASFSGNGSGITTLNASNITSGTLSDDRLSSNVAFKDIDNNFSVSQSINGDLNVDGGKITIDTTAITGREDILVSTVSDTALSKFGIANGTTVSGQFVPLFYGYQHVDRPALNFGGYGNASEDSSASDPLLNFTVANTNNASNPLAGTLTSILNRDVISFRTSTREYLRVKANGHVGIGNITDPSEMLDVDGNAKITGDLIVNAVTIPNGEFYNSRRSSGNLSLPILGHPSGSDVVRLLSSGGFDFVDGSLSNLMRIDSSGFVSIGSSSTSANLDVVGNRGIYQRDNSGGRIVFDDTDVADAATPMSVISNSAGSLIFSRANRNASTGLTTGTTEAMRITSSGNVAIGTTNPTTITNYRSLTLDGTSGSILDLRGGGTLGARIVGTASGMAIETGGATFMNFYTNNTERMRIDSSGNVLIGTTSYVGTGAQGVAAGNSVCLGGSRPWSWFVGNSDNGSYVMYIQSIGTATHELINFVASTVSVGSITSNGTATSYNTSSDYRLKENVVEMTGALDRLDALKPSRFNFISEPEKTVDGFLAHEVQDIVPEAITGEKDAVDEEGNPIYQGIDQAKLVPLLVGAVKEQQTQIKEQQAIIKDLTERIEKLEK